MQERNAAAATSVDANEDSTGDDGELEADKELWDEIQDAIASLPPVVFKGEASAGGASQNVDPPPIWSRVPQDFIITFIGQKLRSMPCKNQGYVLDGFPPTYDVASTLFKSK